MLLYENTDFYRTTDDGNERIPVVPPPKRVRQTVSMASFKSLAISSFSFPFNNVLRIREALKLQTLPYASTGEMDLFPSVLEKGSRNSSGIVWFVPSVELEKLTPPLPNVENRLWPAPMSLVSEIQGEGGVLWLDENSACSMLWEGGIPVLYRWKARSRTTAEAERAWLEAYCKTKEKELGAFFALDATRPSELARLPQIVKESLAAYPWIGDVNLSKSALDSALVLERTVRLGTRVASWFLVFGLLAMAGNGLRYYEARKGVAEIRRRASQVYIEAFEPSRTTPVSDPIGLARQRLEDLLNPSDGRHLNDVLEDLGNILEQNSSMDITIDTMRYALNEVDYTGSAPDTATVWDFQRSWAEKAETARVENIQSAPNIGFRYDLRVRW